jgi:NADH-quinone oxidoreductase subunit H
MIAEVERIPFDMPEAEAELVEGWWTEYGGMRWGLLFASEYLRCYAACILMAHFFFGGYHAPFANFIGDLGVFGDAYLAIPGIVWVLLKAWFFFAIFVWVRAAFPRIRTDQILELGWKYLLPLSLINLAFAFILRLYVFDGNTWGPGSGMIIPAVITIVSLILFVVLSVDEDPDWEGQRMSHTRTMTPAGTHTIGED